jgi:hypothetical protein
MNIPMGPNTRSHLLATTLLMAAGALMPAAHLMAAPPVPPNLTQGAAVDRKLTYNLGSTGLRGWISNKNATYYGNSRYSGLSPAATYVLTYALPLKKLLITGKTANQVIRKMDAAASPALPDILKAVAKTEEPLQPINWADAIQLTHGQLAAALFAGGLTDSLKTADKKLVYPAVGVVSRNADGMARSQLKGYFEGTLSAEDVRALGPEILAAVEQIAPADTMFGQEIRMGGAMALSKYHYQEGVRALADLLKDINGHGSETRIPGILNQLKSYGKAAREAIPDMKEFILIIQHGEMPDHPANLKKVADTNEAIKFIENSTNQPGMPTLAPTKNI